MRQDDEYFVTAKLTLRGAGLPLRRSAFQS